jgi:flagellin-like protein
MRRLFKELAGRQKGITGLETSIILIAFVVVAAVLAYTVMSAGLFTTQKSQESVYSGLQKVQGAVGLRGGVIGCKDNLNLGGTGSLGRLKITLAVVSQDGQMDLTPAYTLDAQSGALLHSNPDGHRLMISYQDRDVSIEDCAWTVEWSGKNNGNHILDYSEKAVISIWLHNFDGAQWGPVISEGSPFLGSHYLDTSRTFTLDLKHNSGGVLSIQRTTPDYLFDVVSLE